MTGCAVGILGVGRLGEAVAAALLADAELPALYVTPRSRERVARLVDRDRRVEVAEPQTILRHADIVVIALTAADAREVLPALAFESRHQVISLMAEMRLAELQALAAPAGGVCRLLALCSVTGGGQQLPLYPAIPAAEALFGRTNTLVGVESEEQLLAFWSVTALLSSIMLVGEVAADWLARPGVAAAPAEDYVRSLFADVDHAMAGGLKAGVQEVSTPGGLNRMMRQGLYDFGLADEIARGLDLVYRRLTAE